MDFNEILRKNVTYDNTERHKKLGFILFQENTFWEKP